MKAERARIEDNVKQPRKTIDTDSQEATSNKQGRTISIKRFKHVIYFLLTESKFHV